MFWTRNTSCREVASKYRSLVTCNCSHRPETSAKWDHLFWDMAGLFKQLLSTRIFILGQYDARSPYDIFSNLGCWFVSFPGPVAQCQWHGSGRIWALDVNIAIFETAVLVPKTWGSWNLDDDPFVFDTFKLDKYAVYTDAMWLEPRSCYQKSRKHWEYIHAIFVPIFSYIITLRCFPDM